MPKYSIVIPLHNEQENVTDLYDRLKAVMEANGESFEMVLVDDGSSDETFNLLRQIAGVDSRVTVVRLRRNFGQTSALAAGFDHARGEYIIAMDGDLQHDPGDIPLFIEKISEGYDIVSGWRKVRIDNFWLRRFPSRCANWLMAKLSGVDIHDFGTTFKAYRREILEQVPLYGELHRFIPALASWHGASICEVPIRNVNRERGVSHYGISRTFRVFFDLDHHPLPAAIPGPPPALLWHRRHVWNLRRDGHHVLAVRGEVLAAHLNHGGAWTSHDFRGGGAAGGAEPAGDWAAGGVAGPPLPRADAESALLSGSGAARA